MMQSTYLQVILHFEHKKITNHEFAPFLPDF